jgi:hypothetical protein
MFEHSGQFGGRLRQAALKSTLSDVARVIGEDPDDDEPA